MERITKEVSIEIKLKKLSEHYVLCVLGTGDLAHHLIEDAIILLAEYGVQNINMTPDHIDHAISVLKKKKDDLRDVRYKEVLTG
jgi:hypothetical protein